MARYPRLSVVGAVSDFAAANSSVTDDGEEASLLALTLATYYCIGPSIPVTLKTRQAGGTATLCGAAEFTTPSNPPKFYRTQTIGNDVFCNGCLLSGTCTTACCNGFGFNFTGAYTYSATTCAQTNTLDQPYYFSDGVTDCGCLGTPGTHFPQTLPFTPAFAAGYASQVTTPTRIEWTYPGSCHNFTGQNYKVTGQVFTQLSNEDTDADAIARCLVANPFPGSFSNCGAPATCALAAYQQRTGQSFVYKAAQFQIAGTGLAANQLYYGRIDIYRRTYGSGSYALFETLIFAGNSDGSGNVTFSGDVPNDLGYETYADNPRVCRGP